MKTIDVLRELGLNQLEAEIYLFLLPQPPLTAYKVAKHLGKPAANVYKSIESLARKGAVLLEDGVHQTCSAVPAKDFIRRTERHFQDLARQAASQLAKFTVSPLEERVFRLDSVEQVVTTARDMIRSATATLVADCSPGPLTRFDGLLADAASRGLSVRVLTDTPATIPGVEVTVVPPEARTVPFALADQLNLVSDGRHSLTALISPDGTVLYQAYWTNSRYLACSQHAAQASQETILRALAAHEQGGDAIAILKAHPSYPSLPGQQDLLGNE